MSTIVLERLIQQTETLTADELLSLASQLVEKARRRYPQSTTPRRMWRDICGIVSYPLVGEDAQVWVSRMRQEADEERERQWRRST